MQRRTNKALVSLALLVSMLFSLLPNLPQATATNLTAATPQEAAVLPEKSPVYQLDASCKLLSYVDEAAIAESNHIARLPSEETLSTYAFLNSDGTKTVYYMNEAVKFLDSDGKVVEKDIALTAASGGYTTTRNNIGLTLPGDPAEGIRLTYEEKYITLTPQGGTFRTATQATEKAVTYPNFYGAGTSLVYTPTLSGVKEDIVLQSYTGVSSFTFTLNTNGLNLYQANGRYYLAEGKTAVRRFELGDMVAFDARGQFSVGTASVTTVMPGQAYRITVTVDEDFLADSGTVYPLSVTSSITVKDTGTVANAIEDTSIYSGRPTMNANWPYMHCGYYSSDYKIGRILVRLPGLTSHDTYQSMAANDIVSAIFYIKEATGTAGLQINLHANTGSSAWTESGATWSNAGVALSTTYTYATANGNAVTGFDITALVKDWKANPQNAAKGFVLKKPDEGAGSKGFCSSEFGTTSYRPYVTVTYEPAPTTADVPDGVYRIISKSANKPIGADMSIVSPTGIVTQATSTQYSQQYFQLWRINHLGAGLYCIRPLHKLSMALSVNETGIYACEIGALAVDAMSKVPACARWFIRNTSDGYIFENYENPSVTMMVASNGTTAGINIVSGTYTAGSSQFRFELNPVTAVAGALFLFQPSTNSYISSYDTTPATISVTPGSTKSLSGLGLVLSVCDTADPSPTAQWSSSNEAVAIVDSATGAITAKSTGTTTIQALRRIGSVNYVLSYNLVVTISDGIYYMMYGNLEYADTSNQNGNIQLSALSGSNTQRWVFTNLGNNIFTIHSAASATKYYLSTSGQNVVLKNQSTIDNTMKWNVSATGSGTFTLTPLSHQSSNYVLDVSNSDVLVLEPHGNNNGQWFIYQSNPCLLNVYFDETHLTRRDQDIVYAVDEISEHLQAVQEEYLERFNILLNYNGPELYVTYANENECEPFSAAYICTHGTCSNSTSWDESDYENYHHHNIHNILFRMPQPIAPIHATVLYIGHYYCITRGAHYVNDDSLGAHILPPGEVDPKALVMASYMEYKDNTNYIRSLMHEIGHLFGTIDHYAVDDEHSTENIRTTQQMNEDDDYDGNFSDSCLYGRNRFDAYETTNLIICEGCQNIIRNNATKYFDAG